jgi:hypothetical protein
VADAVYAAAPHPDPLPVRSRDGERGRMRLSLFTWHGLSCPLPACGERVRGDHRGCRCRNCRGGATGRSPYAADAAHHRHVPSRRGGRSGARPSSSRHTRTSPQPHSEMAREAGPRSLIPRSVARGHASRGTWLARAWRASKLAAAPHPDPLPVRFATRRHADAGITPGPLGHRCPPRAFRSRSRPRPHRVRPS